MDKYNQDDRHNNVEKQSNILNEDFKNETKYGEFICSYFGWLPITEQKERAEELNRMTKKSQDKH